MSGKSPNNGSSDLTCPECGETCDVEMIFNEPENEIVARAPTKKRVLTCPACGYSSSNTVSYDEDRTCPECGNAESVIVREDEEMKTKEGYTLYCESCEFEFVGKWK